MQLGSKLQTYNVPNPYYVGPFAFSINPGNSPKRKTITEKLSYDSPNPEASKRLASRSTRPEPKLVGGSIVEAVVVRVWKPLHDSTWD